MGPKSNNDWAEWRRFVLAELKRLSKESSATHKQLTSYNEILIRNTATLEEHVKRTNLLEAKVGHIDTHVKKVEALAWLVSKEHWPIKLFLAAAACAVAYLVKVYF